MLSSSHFLIAVVIHEVDPAIYAATSSNAWMLKSPGTHNSSGTKRNFDCRLCSLLLAAPYYTPATRVPHHQKQQIFFKVFFLQKEGDSKNRNSKGRDHFPSKVELIMLLLRRSQPLLYWHWRSTWLSYFDGAWSCASCSRSDQEKCTVKV